MSRRDILAIGGSLGAVQVVKRLCAELPADFAAKVMIVIHVGAQGANLLASIFDAESPLAVSTATDGEALLSGHVYVAPADHHLLVVDGVARLGKGPRENMARPALDPLFRSVGLCYGPRAIGLVLTGMLNDGAAGLADLKRCGGITIVQNPADAEAPSMPLGALATSEIDYRAPLAQLPSLLAALVEQEAGPPVACPDEVRLEVEIALGQAIGSGVLMEFADPAALSCPACGGVLSQIRRAPLRFRCQVGHGYTAETLASQKEDTLDEAMRVALRIVEERALLTGKIAEDAHRSGRHAAAKLNQTRAEESHRYADILRRAMVET